jgi:hypothetical protein
MTFIGDKGDEVSALGGVIKSLEADGSAVMVGNRIRSYKNLH